MKKLVICFLVLSILFISLIGCETSDNECQKCFNVEQLEAKIIQKMFYIANDSNYSNSQDYRDGEINGYTIILEIIKNMKE